MDTDDRPKKRLPSCDLCRVRKVKCVKDLDRSASRCQGCISLNQRCEYTRSRKKPGPANKYAREAPAAAAPAEDFGDNYSQVAGSSSSSVPLPTRGAPFSSPRYSALHLPPPTNRPRWSSPPPQSHRLQQEHSIVGGGGLSLPLADPVAPSNPLPPPPPPPELDAEWSWLPISPGALQYGIASETTEPAHDPMPRWWANSSHSAQSADRHGDSVHFTSSSMHSNLPPIQDPGSAGRNGSLHSEPQTYTNLSSTAVARATSVDDVLPWNTLMRILHAYHAYLYPLMPIMHWPTFLHQLISREDERSLTWRAYLLALLAYSIIQLPRSSLSFLEIGQLRRLHQRCFILSSSLKNRKLTKLTSTDIATLYCQHIYLSSLGRTNAANVTLVDAIRLAQAMNLHDERIEAEGIDCVEREVRRRIFWLLYGSDRTITAVTSSPLLISEADVHLPLPLPVDDELITTAGAFPQPAHTTSILSGFHHVSRVFHLLGVVLTATRYLSSLASPFSTLSLPPVLPTPRPASQFRDALDGILADLPGPLQLSNRTGELPPHEVKGETGSDAFAICKANILVTQAMVRFAIRQYAAAMGEREDDLDDKAWTERHLLDMLETMSSESLAANGDSLRTKVLYFVASSVIDKYHSNADGLTYISDFLAMYSRIRDEQEANILLEATESGFPSRVPSPR